MTSRETKRVSNKNRLLIFVATYNESKNIRLLIDELVSLDLDADILVVDDNSNDGSLEIFENLKREYSNLRVVIRPRKLGIGSAHKYSLIYAMRHNYDILITMDADFSHDPKYIPDLLAAHGPDKVVTGSRYCEGGSSDYTGYRNFVSRMGNFVARNMLGFKIKELTTYFRVFDVNKMKDVELHRVKSNGYAYGLELFCRLRDAGVEIVEVPIHFQDRTRGVSKIPKWQIVTSATSLFVLALDRIGGRRRKLRPDHHIFSDQCPVCEDDIFALQNFSSDELNPAVDPNQVKNSYEGFQCTSVGKRNYPAVYRCLHCDLQQVLPSSIPADLENKYEAVEDRIYLENSKVRERTFEKLYQNIEQYIDKNNKVLEVGSYVGMFLANLKKHGIQADGIEPSEWAVEYSKNNFGVSAVQGFLNSGQDGLDDEYGTVVSWDVFEHVRDPKKFIEDAAARLKSGGYLCLTTLDVDSWPPKMLKTKWPWLMNMHVFYFDKDCVEDIFARCGIELVETRPYTHYARPSYILERGFEGFPGIIRGPMKGLAKLLPNGLMVPVALGDVKLFVGRKVDGK